MKNKSLYKTNPYLKDAARAKKLIIRSIASSTAIETGESIKSIEAKLSHQRSSKNRETLS